MLPLFSFAQQVTASAGDHFSTGNLSLSWTLGEPVIETFEDGNSIVTQGFHQTALMITSVGGVGAALAIKAFPNPAGDQLTLSIPLNLNGELQMELFDGFGRRLRALDLGAGETVVPLTGLPAGHYLLLVRQGNSAMKTFKIVKN